MKTSDERINSINSKVKTKRKERALIWGASVTACVVLVIAVVCSLPILGESVPNINAYKNDEYYPIIQKINEQYQDTKHSVFESLGNVFDGGFMMKGEDLAVAPASPEITESSSNKYQETTLNQVDGVIEGDLLKRSATHAFYLQNAHPQGEEPCLQLSICSYYGASIMRDSNSYIKAEDGTSFTRYASGHIDAELFLSEDASRVTVITSCLSEKNVAYTTVITLDVSDVMHVREVNRVYISGEYLSARKVNGKLLVITNFYVGYYGRYGYNQVDYNKRETYVPQCGSAINGDFISIKNIHVPNNCQDINYTVLALLDERTLQVSDSYAVFAYSQDVYVSGEYIAVFRNSSYYYEAQFAYGNEIEINRNTSQKYITRVQVSEIVALKYGDGFAKQGEIGLDGYINDRYSMDEKDGVLRVFTTVNHTQIYNKNDDRIYGPQPNPVNVSLFCVDLSQMEVIASKQSFAPAGDEVKSARFDGDTAYVCTARRNTDPVFYFDLSDLNNITYVDTGEIAGFSVNLIKFNNLLLGIGQGQNNGVLKVEMYKQSNDPEAENGVISVGKYERNGLFSYEHKAHFIDAEHALIGLQIYDYEDDLVTSNPNGSRNKYLLLFYSEEYQSFQVVSQEAFDSDYDYVRAFYDSGVVYVFGVDRFTLIDLNKVTIPQ